MLLRAIQPQLDAAPRLPTQRRWAGGYVLRPLCQEDLGERVHHRPRRKRRDGLQPSAVPVARLRLGQQTDELGRRAITESWVSDELQVVAVVPAGPDEHRLVACQELGDREAERLSDESAIQAGIACLDEVGNRLPVRRAGQMNDPLVRHGEIRVHEKDPEVLAPLERLQQGGGHERDVQLVAAAMPADHERIGGNAEPGSRVFASRWQIDDVRHMGIAAPGHGVGQPFRDIGVSRAVRRENLKDHMHDGPAGGRKAPVLTHELEKIDEVELLSLHCPLHFLLRSISEGRKLLGEAHHMGRVRRVSRVIENDRIDAQKRAGIAGIVEHRDGGAPLRDASGIETNTHGRDRAPQRDEANHKHDYY